MEGSSGEGEGETDAVSFGVGEEPLAKETEARLRNLSNGEVDGVGTTPGGRLGLELAVFSRLFENFSRALMRFEMPEETFIFFATNTGTGLACWFSK